MGQVISPVASNYSDGTTQLQALAGKQGEALCADLHGQYYTAAARGKVFKFNRTAVTVPAIAVSLISVFSLHNPPSSGVMAEVISTEIGQCLAAVVPNVIAWYTTTAALTVLGTFTTAAVAGTNMFSARVGDTASPACVPYSAYTHSGTPVRLEMLASFGATTDAVVVPSIVRNHNGTLLLPPGFIISLAASTTVNTTSGLDLGVTWAEWTFSASA